MKLLTWKEDLSQHSEKLDITLKYFLRKVKIALLKIGGKK